VRVIAADSRMSLDRRSSPPPAHGPRHPGRPRRRRHVGGQPGRRTDGGAGVERATEPRQTPARRPRRSDPAADRRQRAAARQPRRLPRVARPRPAPDGRGPRGRHHMMGNAPPNPAVAVLFHDQSHPVASTSGARPTRPALANYFRSDRETGSRRRRPNRRTTGRLRRMNAPLDRGIIRVSHLRTRTSSNERRQTTRGHFRFRCGVLIGTQHNCFRLRRGGASCFGRRCRRDEQPGLQRKINVVINRLTDSNDHRNELAVQKVK